MKHTKGFTILEVLLIVAAIGILLSAIILVLDPLSRFQKSRDQRRELDVQIIQTAVIQYESVTDSEVPGISSTLQEIKNPNALGNCSGYIDLELPELISLVREIPIDPLVEDECGSGYLIARIDNSIVVEADLSELREVRVE